MVMHFGLTHEDIQDKCMELLLKNDIYVKYNYDLLNKNMKGNITKYFNSVRNSTTITTSVTKPTVTKTASKKKTTTTKSKVKKEVK